LEEHKTMKIFWNVIGGLLILAGGIWFLQGIGIVGGSYMSGHPQWAFYGGLAVILGAGLVYLVDRPRAR
jgi:hypothetical protein